MSGDAWSLKFFDICLTVEEKNSTKTSNRKTDPPPRSVIERERATMLPLDHSGGHMTLLNMKLKYHACENS